MALLHKLQSDACREQSARFSVRSHPEKFEKKNKTKSIRMLLLRDLYTNSIKPKGIDSHPTFHPVLSEEPVEYILLHNEARKE